MASNFNNNDLNRKKNINNSKERIKSRNPNTFHNSVECILCGKNIRDMSSAITEKQSRKPAHFDCIIKVLSLEEAVKDGEKIVYLGSGRFAVIKMDNNQNKKFKIVKEIIYEEQEDEFPEWRETLKKDIL